MFENLQHYVYGERIQKIIKNIQVVREITITEVQPFSTKNVTTLTENDIIISDPASDDISLLKPTGIIFKNNCYVLQHKLIGTMYSPDGHCFEENGFEGFTCLTLHGELFRDEPDAYTDRFILKCQPNKYSQNIETVDTWLQFCQSNGII